MADKMHDIAARAWMLTQAAKSGESRAVRLERQGMLKAQERLLASIRKAPDATPDDIEIVQTCVAWAERALGILPPEEDWKKLQRAREKTRERQRRWRIKHGHVDPTETEFEKRWRIRRLRAGKLAPSIEERNARRQEHGEPLLESKS